jgi:hypothetical protein
VVLITGPWGEAVDLLVAEGLTSAVGEIGGTVGGALWSGAFGGASGAAGTMAGNYAGNKPLFKRVGFGATLGALATSPRFQ